MSITDEDGLTKYGWMKKKGGFFKTWSKCFCELHQTEFYIRKSDKSHELETRVPIQATTQVKIVDDKKGSYILVDFHDDMKDSEKVQSKNSKKDKSNKNNKTKSSSKGLVLKCNDTSELKRWFIALRSATFHNAIISIHSFDILSVIGRGFFGKVLLVSHKETKELFAIKTVHKMRLLNQEKVNTILAERNIMRQCKHPFVVSLLFAFQSATKFYLGLEYVPGGELYSLMKKRYKFTRPQIKLYIAEISLALDHLHSIGVVYRDIKPENILIDEEGHLKLTDFGLSKNIKKTKITYSFCGTPDYMAPEVVEKRGHNYPVDWWGLGVLTYQLFFDKSPFYDENRNKMCSNIVLKEPEFPKDADPDTKDFILQLLIKNPKNRANFKSLKKHHFWGDLNFDKVLAKKYKPEYIPIVKDPRSPDNFDEEFTNEATIDSVATPTVGDRNIFRNFSFMGALDDFIIDEEHDDEEQYTQMSEYPIAQQVFQQ
ncbi:Protein kinase 2 [Tritrichomonas foetus]|uniref:Protein kinase 2 n=1 Tax=Tritrichomonas foetus TaxID=1144522 RepID=A0A1J4K6M3_9EUKA|nr:Protein kinase 2 [Tritrichomonas foetus]|eukprot:OHT05101.1 Protein kinase 2 [Tritrichomonas foetus]